MCRILAQALIFFVEIPLDMKKPDSLDMFYQRISYDIFCPKATIAEFLYSDYLRCPEGSFWKDVERSGKRYL